MAVAPSPERADDYPTLFRTLLARSAAVALDTLDPQAPRLEEDARERSLYALSMALDLAEAWQTARDLTLAIAPHMEIQGYRQEWIDFLAKALTQATAQQDTRAVARLYVYLGRIHQLLTQFAEAESCFREGLSRAEMIGDQATQVAALDRLAIRAVEQADYPAACALAERVLALLPADDVARAPSLFILGVVALHEARLDDSIRFYLEARRICQAPNNVRLLAQAERNLGLAYLNARRFAEAETCLLRAIELFASIDNTFELATAQSELGNVYWYSGDYVRALACYNACEPVFVKAGHRLWQAHIHNSRGCTLREMGRLDEALAAFQLAIAVGRELGSRVDTAHFLDSLARLHLQQGQPAEALRVWRAALDELDCLPARPHLIYDMIAHEIEQLQTASHVA